MKSFKLIKEYPYSPPVGTIAKQHSSSAKLFYLSNNEGIIEEEALIANPEFWEELPEEKFQVLTYRVDSERFDTRRTNGLYAIEVPEKDRQLYGIYPQSSYKLSEIHTVRLATGKVVSVGDNIKLSNVDYDRIGDETEATTIIKKFSIKDGKLIVSVEFTLVSQTTIDCDTQRII